MKKITDWINKKITHNRDNVGDFGVRCIIHIPIGIIMSIPVMGWGLVYLFKFYERNEDAHHEDEAWKDVYGAMIGFVVGMGVQLWMIFGVLLPIMTKTTIT